MKKTPKRPTAGLVAVASPPVGGAVYTVTESGIALIRQMTQDGCSLATISDALGIGGDAFRALRKRQPEVQAALDVGLGVMQDELVDRLMKQARKGNTTAMIFLLKARCGLRDVGPANPEQAAPTVNINITSPMSDADFRQMITVESPDAE